MISKRSEVHLKTLCNDLVCEDATLQPDVFIEEGKQLFMKSILIPMTYY